MKYTLKEILMIATAMVIVAPALFAANTPAAVPATDTAIVPTWVVRQYLQTGTAPSYVRALNPTTTVALSALVGNISSSLLEVLDASKILYGTTIHGRAGTAFPAKPLWTILLNCYDYSSSDDLCGSEPTLLAGFLDNYKTYTAGNPSAAITDVYGSQRSYTDNSDGTITDNSTGLLWQKCPLGLTYSDGNCTGASESRLAWENSNVACAALGAGWRLPRQHELYTLVTHMTTPVLNSPFYVATASGGDTYVWSLTSRRGETAKAWVTDVRTGSTSVKDKDQDTSLIYCVKNS